MQIVVEQVLLLLLFISIGYTLGKTKLANFSHTKILSVLGVYVFIPCNIFRTFSNNFTVDYLSEKYPLILAGLAIVVLMTLLSFPFGKLMAKDSYQQAIYRYSFVMPNYGYVGFALASGIFGDGMLLNVMLFTLPMSFYTYTLGFCSLTRSPLKLKKIISPANIAILIGGTIGLLGIPLPKVVDTLASRATSCMGPVSMLLTGIVIAEYKLSDLFTNTRAYVMSVLRLVVIPVSIAGVMTLLGLRELVPTVLLIQAMPCGMNTIVFPKLVGEDCRTGAALTCITSLLCVATIPLCLWLFGITV